MTVPTTAVKTDYLALRLFKAVIEIQPSLKDLNELDLKDEMFLNVVAIDQYRWLLTHRGTHGCWPSVAAFESAYEELPLAAEPLAHLAGELKTRKASFDLTKALKEAAGHLDSKNVPAAMSAISAAMLALKPASSKVISFKETAEARTVEYAAMKAGGGPVKIPTPWPTLDKETLGLVDGSLNVVVAPPNTGKSWMCCLLCNHLLNLGHKVLFVTLEMSARRMLTRLDSLKFKLPFGQLRDATLDAATQAGWEADAKAAASLVGDVVVVDKMTARTVFDTYKQVQQHVPRVVMIDGGYRFEGANARVTGWESSSKIVADLQLYAETSNIPWVVTTQYELSKDAPKSKGTDHPMKMAGVKYAKEWVINPDVVIGMYQDDFDRLTGKMNLIMLKTRDHSGEGTTSVIPINWNLSTGNFSEIPAFTTASTVEEEPSALAAIEELFGEP
jgi:replicative DNA helicase